MDPNDINFTMQSGLGHPSQNTGPVDWENAFSLMAIAAFFMEKATLAAGRYVEAAGRRNITARDMVLCLKYTALPSSNFWQTENLLEHCQQWRERLLSPDDEDEISEEEDEEEEEDVEEEEEFSYAESVDDFTTAVNGSEAAFEAWEPTDEMGAIVRRAIVRAELNLQ